MRLRFGNPGSLSAGAVTSVRGPRSYSQEGAWMSAARYAAGEGRSRGHVEMVGSARISTIYIHVQPHDSESGGRELTNM